MSNMKDYMDKMMEGVEEINLKQHDENEQTHYIILKNVDNGCGTKWDIGVGIMATAMLSLIATTLGKIPAHEYIEDGNVIVAYLNEKQILRMIETAEILEMDVGSEDLSRELKFLLDCKHPES